MTEQLLRLPEVSQIVQLSKADIYRKLKTGDFPKQRKRSHKVVVWFRSEVEAWMAAEIERLT